MRSPAQTSRLLKFAWLAVALALSSVVPAALVPSAWADEFEREPIQYSQTAPDNPVSRLMERIESGEVKLEYAPNLGYLPALLNALGVPQSSQTLVFSKTSLQRHRISARTPRALYFNDDVYVGYCQQGDVLEISAADARLGTVFYTLAQDSTAPPKIVRQGDNCLICHASSHTKNVPGHLLRSVYVEPSGMPILSAGTHRTNQASPLHERWGGWYVTGNHGPQKHLGNLTIRGRDVPALVDNSAGMNLADLGDRFDATAYLSGHSDIVALLVLGHQVDAHNLITQANFTARQALHYQQSLNRELREPADKIWESTRSRIKSVGEPLVEYLLFSEEAEIRHPIEGSSAFAEEFAAQGPRDRHGRSLRDFDLQRRMFRYPCSYLIYSPSFQALPDNIREYVFERMWSILRGQDQTKPFSHLTPEGRQAILEILTDTLPTLPDTWKTPAAAVQ